jgi:heme/copper-type cytochrome/quinol oxidase subunit 4
MLKQIFKKGAKQSIDESRATMNIRKKQVFFGITVILSLIAFKILMKGVIDLIGDFLSSQECAPLGFWINGLFVVMNIFILVVGFIYVKKKFTNWISWSLIDTIKVGVIVSITSWFGLSMLIISLSSLFSDFFWCY